MKPFAIRAALVVDVDPELNDLLGRILQPGIWAIQHVPTNQAAFQAAQGKAFELIITSEKTSGKEDIELLRKIRVVRPHIRLIILANESTASDVLASMREHAFSFFSKPYSFEQLGNIIQMAIEAPCWDDGIEIESATPEWIKLKVRCQIRTADRLLDRHMFATQLEYRLSLPKRFGVAGFAGIGEVIPGGSQLFRSNHLLPAIGGGPRFDLSTKYHVNLRTDFARGKDSWTWSMGMGEAF